MAILAYDDVMVREPRLLVPRGRRFIADAHLSNQAVSMQYTNFSVAAWIYSHVAPSGSETIFAFGNGDAGTYPYWWFLSNSGTIELQTSLFSGYNGVYGPATQLAAAGKWTHCAAVASGTSGQVYANAVPGSAGTIHEMATWTKTSIGALVYAGPTTGKATTLSIAQVALFNKAISADDVMRLYRGTCPDKIAGYMDAWYLASESGPAISRSKKVRLDGTAGYSNAPQISMIENCP